MDVLFKFCDSQANMQLELRMPYCFLQNECILEGQWWNGQWHATTGYSWPVTYAKISVNIIYSTLPESRRQKNEKYYLINMLQISPVAKLV